MRRSNGIIALTLVVRDEDDILAANLDYHLAHGVDLIFVIDHASRDRTSEILREYAASGRVRAFRDEAPAHDQVGRVNRLLRLAEGEGAEWIIHSDADEFWIPVAGSLRDVLAAVPARYGYLKVSRTNFRPTRPGTEPFYDRMLLREVRSLNGRGGELEPKVAQRRLIAAGVRAGNHELEAPALEAAPDVGALEVFHFPIRSFEQFERKVVNTGIGYELLENRGEGVGVDQLTLLEMHRRGELRSYYDALATDAEHADESLESDELVIDRRLRAYMHELNDRGDPRAASPVVTDVLRKVWLTAASIDDQRREAEDRARKLHAALADAARERDVALGQTRELSDALATIQGSRIMRYTAPARRIYYRMRRPTG